MSTQTLPLVTARARTAADRRFYLVMAVASTLVIFTGFSRSYYLRAHYATGPALSLLVHVHGLVFTLWMLYFVLQTALIAVRRPRLHRSLGITGVVLTLVMAVLGFTVAFTAARLHHGGAGQDAETILLVGLIDLFTFLGFFALGYLRRRDRESHQRLMLFAVIVGLLGPGLGRLGSVGVPLAAISLVDFAFLFAGPIYDLITRRRIHPVYIYGCLYAIATFTPLRFLVGHTAWWHTVAHRLTGM